MRLVLGQVRRNIQVHSDPRKFPFDIHWEEINRLEKMNGELENDLNSFRRLLFEEKSNRNPVGPGVRMKRGLIDVLGYGLKYLFGTADAKDVHAADQQVTYLRTLDEIVKQNTRDTIDLARVLRDSIRNFSLQLHRDEADLLDIQEAIEKPVRYSAAIREIEMAILDIKFSLTQLQEALDLTSLGKLSSVLSNPDNLSMILQQVSLQLPPGVSMLTGLTVEDVYVYYTIATVHAVATSKSIRLFIDIPLKAADRYFELYQVHSFPFFHIGINRFIKIDEPFSYIAVAENRQFFAMTTPHMLAKCDKDLYVVCPSDLVLRTPGEPNCLTALFLGKVDIVPQMCKRLVLSDKFAPVWIRSPDFKYWM
jgi:hypothetical protein